MLCRHGVAVSRDAGRAPRVHVVVVDVLHGGGVPAVRHLAGTLAAPVRGAAYQDNHGPDRIGERDD